MPTLALQAHVTSARTAGFDDILNATVMATVAEIYEKEFAFVWRNLRRLGVRQTSLEDAAHDVFLVVLRRIQEFERRSSLQTWIFGIVYNVAFEYRRKQAKDGLVDDVVELQISPQRTPEENRQRQESLLLLNSLLGRLDLDQRAVFIMIDVEGLSAPEAANALHIKVNTVYSRLRLARAAFDAALYRSAQQLHRNG
jgi:RNA polymerase sigma-70 factor, ECF subfamily